MTPEAMMKKKKVKRKENWVVSIIILLLDTSGDAQVVPALLNASRHVDACSFLLVDSRVTFVLVIIVPCIFTCGRSEGPCRIVC